jgi:hypothetical protein
MEVFRPSRMDSLIPGTDSRGTVSRVAFQSSSETRTALALLPAMTMGS